MGRITILLADETEARLRSLSEHAEINVSTLCNIAVKELLRHPEKVLATAAKS